MNQTATIFTDYAAARAYLEPFAHLPGQVAPDAALQRAQALMSALGNPQDCVPVIHLAGTSGKGSTATILAAILRAHGLSVGLGLSPHVRHLLERVQIDGAPISESDFCRELGAMVPAIAALQHSEVGPPSFFEILIALSYAIFAAQNVDVVVMETGLGGRYDATNTVTRRDKIALLTDIGYDHTDLLGDTLAQIAAQKAGIIQSGNRVLTHLQPAEAQEVIVAECEWQDAPLLILDPQRAIHNLRLYPEHLIFDLELPDQPTRLRDLHLSLAGAHQAQNAGLAISAAQLFLSGIDRMLDEAAMRHALARITLLGRMDHREWGGAQIILDGAHNPQKMRALCDALTALYPDQRFIFVVALKAGKDHHAILEQILPLAAAVYLTRFDNQDQGMTVTAAAPHELAQALPSHPKIATHIAPTAANAIRLAVDSANTLCRSLHKSPPLVITGSLYLLAEAYAVLDETYDA